MTPTTFQRASDLFLEARRLPLLEQDEFLSLACGGNESLREAVVALLAAEHQPLPFQDLAENLRPIQSGLQSDVANGDFAGTTYSGLKLDAEGVTRIGPYRLLQKIGEGGFGNVYMAEQLEPLRRRVALKILKLGMDTKQVIARFEAERQALALMDHANITKVLDAGATESGRPFFVMELVNGIPITDYCDQNRLTPKERIRLLIGVGNAVQHAHMKGVVHRDLKPSNILVTSHDGKPVPKVIDFGIAKALSQRLTDKTLFTQFRELMGTPAYMSPEQAEMSGLDIDTRADVYSLGVLLYELLTGVTPHDGRTLRQVPITEFQRILREVDPATPSSRISTMMVLAPRNDANSCRNVATPEEIASRRRTDPKALRHTLRGDLDWIIMRCLEKDRTRRYESASGLVLDLERCLENQPIAAGPPGPVYLLRKFARRHRGVAFAAGTILIALLLGLATASYGLMRAMEERDHARFAEGQLAQQCQSENLAREAAVLAEKRARADANEAQRQAARAQAAFGFLRQILEASNPAKSRGSEPTVRDVFLNARKLIKRLSSFYPLGIEADIRAMLANVFIGQSALEDAEIELQAALELYRSEFPTTPSEEMVGVLGNLAYVASRRGDREEAAAFLKEAEAILVALGPMDTLSAAVFYQQRGSVFLDSRRPREAATDYEKSLQIRQQRLPEDHPEVIAALCSLAVALHDAKDFQRAEAIDRDVIEKGTRLHGEHATIVVVAKGNLAETLRATLRSEEAKPWFDQAIASARKLYTDPHPHLVVLLLDYGVLHQSDGRYDLALPLFMESLKLAKSVWKGDHRTIASLLSNVADALLRVDRADEAFALAEEGLAMRRRLAGTDAPELAIGKGLLGEIQLARREDALAEPNLKAGFAVAERQFGDAPDEVRYRTRMLEGLIRIAKNRSDFAEASRLEELR